MNHPKFKRLVAVLRIPRAHARGHVELMWEACYETGNPLLGDITAVEGAAEWDGTPGVFCAAALASGLLDLEGDSYRIHDLVENAPDYVRKRHIRHNQRKLNKQPPECPPKTAKRRTTAARTSQTADNGGHCPPNGGFRPETAAIPEPLTQNPTPPQSSIEVAAVAAVTPAKKERARNLLFDAVAEVTGSDPTVTGAHIGKVAAALAKAEPPYTPEEVRLLPSAIRAAGLDFTLTLGAVEKYIGWVRTLPQAKGNAHGHQPQQQSLRYDPKRDAAQRRAAGTASDGELDAGADR